MRRSDLSIHLENFLALKQARAKANPHFGSDHRSRLRFEERLLRSFLAFWQERGYPWPIRADFALDWVMTGSDVNHPCRDEKRLLAVRAFLLQVRTCEARTEIPEVSFRRRYRRRTPYIFSDQEIVRLMDAALQLRVCIRAFTVHALIGVLASTGIRIGEALRLNLGDVRLGANPPHLFIYETKFGKSRNVVLHPSTAARLCLYLEERHAALHGRHSDPFFTNGLLKPLIYNPLRYTFRLLLKRAGIVADAGQRRPTLHSFRHTFAVKRLMLWQREGKDIRQRLSHLAVYLGHYGPESTYWYLSATPELLQTASALFDPQRLPGEGQQ